jgi:hypothetical protein
VSLRFGWNMYEFAIFSSLCSQFSVYSSLPSACMCLQSGTGSGSGTMDYIELKTDILHDNLIMFIQDQNSVVLFLVLGSAFGILHSSSHCEPRNITQLHNPHRLKNCSRIEFLKLTDNGQERFFKLKTVRLHTPSNFLQQ